MASPSRTAQIRATAQHDPASAESMLEKLIAELFDIPVSDLRINRDQYSLNSLNGFFDSGDDRFFFKFHQEEGEEAMRGEYYRADILSRAGLPVDQPVHMSTLPGEQVLVYRRRQEPRFSDVLFDLDQLPDPAAMHRAAAAEAELNDRLLYSAIVSLRPISPQGSRAEPIHRLFHERLIDPETGQYPGGRLARFYVGKTFEFPGGVTLDWPAFRDARPVLNGLEYTRSFGEMIDLAHARYAPDQLADAGGIVAHGDAHNANVWYEAGREADRLAFFDPAFAGDKVPSLLAEVKSTFHNIFAHPFWLYNPELAAERYSAHAAFSGGRLAIETDWSPGPVRKRLLEVKARHYWKGWLAELRRRDMLPEDWEDVIRIGLFLSPTLVMNLRANSARHNPTSSAIAMFVALSAGSRPLSGRDIFTDFFDEVAPR
ncbi:hypothetical protein [Paracoccus albus]|uniref:hypothetical protein n=1 Tax=Paracoccus albus TaxID=3017784 RepID=UPI0022EFFFA8|nr:hypothetical protein [Paracoccus albus]WBU61265.1 hypothetical protein PAF20_04990 [Paracoccus albus]